MKSLECSWSSLHIYMCRCLPISLSLSLYAYMIIFVSFIIITGQRFLTERCSLLALRCLGLLFTPLKIKKLQESIPYILKIVPVSISFPFKLFINIVIFFTAWDTSCWSNWERENNQPHIAMFRDDDDEDTVLNQYFVSVEQELMMETSTLISAIFFTIAAHYIFNLTYHRKSGDVWVFIQEKVLGLASKIGTKRSPSAISHFSGIQRVYDSTNPQED